MALSNIHNKQIDKINAAEKLETRAFYYLLIVFAVNMLVVFVGAPVWLDVAATLLYWFTFGWAMFKTFAFKGLLYRHVRLAKHMLDASEINGVIEIQCHCDEKDNKVDAVKKPSSKKAEPTKENAKD